MTQKKYTYTPIYTNVFPEKRTRIRIPQSPAKPINLSTRDLIKTDLLDQDSWWFKKHIRGVKRPKVGEDVREARAISRYKVKGTLPERIVLKALIDQVHLVNGVDFDFQSSQSGGRIELGGMVVDFLFPIMMLVIQVQGQTHGGFLRSRKDEEQNAILQAMGYRVVDVEEQLIYNEYAFNDWLKRTFDLARSSGSGSVWVQPTNSSSTVHGAYQGETDEETESNEQETLAYIVSKLNYIIDLVERRM